MFHLTAQHPSLVLPAASKEAGEAQTSLTKQECKNYQSINCDRSFTMVGTERLAGVAGGV